MTKTEAAFVAAAMLVFLAWYGRWWYARSRSLLGAWAQANGYKILEATRNSLWQRPPMEMRLTTSRQQSLFRIKVLDLSTQHIRNGWLRLGSYWRGMSDHSAVDVRWDDERV